MACRCATVPPASIAFFFFNPLSLSSLPSPLLSPPLPALRSQVNPLPSARSPRSYLRLLLDPTFLSRPSSSRARYAGSPCPRPSSAGRRGESLRLSPRPDPGEIRSVVTASPLHSTSPLLALSLSSFVSPRSSRPAALIYDQLIWIN